VEERKLVAPAQMLRLKRFREWTDAALLKFQR
jgi:hypothetical protein